MKSMASPHLSHLCFRSNSSEKISFCAPHWEHLQVKDLRFLKFSKPGQCCGVVIGASFYVSACPLRDLFPPNSRLAVTQTSLFPVIKIPPGRAPGTNRDGDCPLFDPWILACTGTIRCIAGVVQELAFLFTRRTAVRRGRCFHLIPAITAFPIGHDRSLQKGSRAAAAGACGWRPGLLWRLLRSISRKGIGKI